MPKSLEAVGPNHSASKLEGKFQTAVKSVRIRLGSKRKPRKECALNEYLAMNPYYLPILL